MAKRHGSELIMTLAVMAILSSLAGLMEAAFLADDVEDAVFL